MTKNKLYYSLYKRVVATMKIMKNKYKVIKFGEILKNFTNGIKNIKTWLKFKIEYYENL